MLNSSRCDLVLSRYLSALGLICSTFAPVAAQTIAAPLDRDDTTEQLEKNWERLNTQVNAIDTLTGPAPAIESSDDLRTLEIPERLIDVNAPPSGVLTEQDAQPDPLLRLPSSTDRQTRVLSLTLEKAVTTAFRNNPSLGAQRDLIEAQAATIASESSRYWPTISVFANLDGFQSGTTTYTPYGNNTYGLGSLFNQKDQTPNFALTKNGKDVSGVSAGPFYQPPGGASGWYPMGSPPMRGFKSITTSLILRELPEFKPHKPVLGNKKISMPTN